MTLTIIATIAFLAHVAMWFSLPGGTRETVATEMGMGRGTLEPELL
jgi:hypothetical protein